MKKKLFSISILMGVALSFVLSQGVFALEKISRSEVILVNDSIEIDEGIGSENETESERDFENVGTVTPETIDVQESSTPPASSEVCGFEVPEEQNYNSSLITVRRKLRVEPGETFRVKVFMKNTGNMPWFSYESTCKGPRMYLGTDKERDRSSQFFSLINRDDNNWTAENRVAMDQLRTDPGEIASFTFWATAGDENDVYKEYMTPMIEGVTWIDDAQFSYEVMVGSVDEPLNDLRKKILYANNSGSVLDINLDGEKLLLVDLSDQTVQLILDGEVIRQFQVSTGAAATPTPTGTTQISLKQEVRVGNKPPHYVMPKFMMFRAGGYGFHALPSLATDGGVFWTEARNHIGIPVSHGCIRLLPEDADFIFEFSEIGTTVTVQW